MPNIFTGQKTPAHSQFGDLLAGVQVLVDLVAAQFLVLALDHRPALGRVLHFALFAQAQPQRAGDVVTRRGQLHVYQALLANARDGYWPAGALMEGDASTGKWQELTPVLSSSCTVFPRSGFLTQAQQGDYAWALWRPYACCERRGQVFLGSVDFL